MKRNQLLLFVVVCLFAFFTAACTVDDSTHIHEFTEWEISQVENESDPVAMVRSCKCGKIVRVDLPPLTDETVWTKETIDSTCLADGKYVYTSEYGVTEIVIPAIEHIYSDWTITTEPTLTEEGAAKRTCEYGETDYATLPVLTDESVWEVSDVVIADYNQSGTATYTSEYGVIVVTENKFVAPYDGKTYANIGANATDKLGEVRPYSWNTAFATFNEKGVAEAIAFPFRGRTVITMVDAESGKIEVNQVYVKEDEEGNLYEDESTRSIYPGYVDFATGTIVRAYNGSFMYSLVLPVSSEAIRTEQLVASSWENAMAMTYTQGETSQNIFVYNEVVYFGVTYTDTLGNPIKADACATAPYVYVKDAEGTLIGSWGYNGEKLVTLDGYEGTYTGETTVVLNGFGGALIGSETGTYVRKAGVFQVHTTDAYYEVTINQTEGTCVVTKPMVTVTFVTGDYTAILPVTVNKNMPMELPTPENDLYTFKGWYLDRQLTKPVPEDYAPSMDVKLYSSWKQKVVVKVISEVELDDITLYLGVGDTVGQSLPKYDIDETNWKVFKGWYLDASFETELPEEAVVTDKDENINVYAKWEALPGYYGTYYGAEVWGATWGNSSKVTLKIDEFGNISGKVTGIVESYDEENQVVLYKKTATSTTTNKLYVDKATGIAVVPYSGDDMAADFYFFSAALTDTDFKAIAQYGITAPKTPGSSTTGYYARVISLATRVGVMNVFFYNNKIVTNVTLQDVEGATLTVDEVKNSKSLVVKDAEGAYVFGVASVGASFAAESKTVVLDHYFGTYTVGENTVVLDGAGNITYGEKTGTYALVEGATYGFDVYLEENTEYYQLTLDGKTATMNKPMVTLTYVTGDGHALVEAEQVNINVPLTLADGSEEGYVFNGWFLDDAFVTPVPENFKVTKATTVYAKYSLPVLLTIVYNNGNENLVQTYSNGENTKVDMPTYAKHAFVGWFTTENFTEGTEWTSGGAITENTTIYAKWEDAPAYNNTYCAIRLNGTTAKGGVTSLYTQTGTAITTIDPYGKAEGKAYPFYGSVEVKNYDNTTGEFDLYVGKSYRHAVVDKASGIIIMTYGTDGSALWNEGYLLSPFETSDYNSKVSSSYWNGGKSRVVVYKVNEETTYNIFIHNDKVYFNVTIANANGEAVVGKEAYTAENLVITAGELVFKFAYDDETATLQPLDGTQGTYTNGTDTLVLNGVNKVTYKGEVGNYAKAEAGLAYNIVAYVGGSFYEITIDQDEMTYTIVKPMVTVTFNALDKATVNPVTVNKNVEITLPTPTNDAFIFRGWYIGETKVSNNYLPTEDVTLVAKWDSLVTLTVVYGNGLDNVTLNYGSGDTVAPKEPPFTDGKAFNGWYLDAALATPYTVGVINEDTIIYAKWIEAIALYGTYTGFNTYGSGGTATSASAANGGGSATSTQKLNVDPLGNVTEYKSGTIQNYDPTTGRFDLKVNTSIYFGVFDAENGILAFSYGSGKENLTNDIMFFVRDASHAYATENSLKGAVWNKGLNKAFAVCATMKDGSVKRFNAYIDVLANKIYTDVTFKANDTVITADKIVANFANLVIYDSKGNVIAH